VKVDIHHYYQVVSKLKKKKGRVAKLQTTMAIMSNVRRISMSTYNALL
jgi:hypothetical protein